MSNNNLIIADTKGRDLAQSLEKRGVTREDFRLLKTVIWPSAKTNEAVLMAVDYCRARGLDPMKRVVHIVPNWDPDQKCYVDSIWPGIAELRTTAMRTNAYAGRDEVVFGPHMTDKIGTMTITYPEWAQCTVYRMVQSVRCAFVGDRVYWRETYASKGADPTPNKMWAKRPRGQIAKVAEANALRIAFPEEAGAEYTAEEMEGQAATGRALESIDGDFETDLEDLNRRLVSHQPAAETRQPPPRSPAAPAAARPNGQARPAAKPEAAPAKPEPKGPTRGQMLADFLTLLEAAETLEAVRALEYVLEELPTGGGTRKSARVAWEERLQDLQPDPGPTRNDVDGWVTLREIESRLDQVDTMEDIAEVEDLIGELSSAEDQVEAARMVRARAAELNEREVADGL